MPKLLRGYAVEIIFVKLIILWKRRKVGLILIAVLTIILCACSGSDKNEQAISGEIGNQKQEQIVDESLVGSTFASGDYEYTVQENGTVYISGYIGNDSELTIPTEVDGYAVTGISDDGFGENDTLTTLTIPGEIKSIGERAFSGCTNLTSVTLEDGVESIGSEAFGNGTMNTCNITKLYITDSVYKMGEMPFGDSDDNIGQDRNGLLYIGYVVVDLTENFDGHIEFDKNTKGIADDALANDPIYSVEEEDYVMPYITDKTVDLPEGIKYIGERAFLDQSVNSFNIPSSVTEIGNYAMLFQSVDDHYELFWDSETRKIYGKAGSTAEKYAASNGLNFVIVSN